MFIVVTCKARACRRKTLHHLVHGGANVHIFCTRCGHERVEKAQTTKGERQ